MISKFHAHKFCKDDLSNIENYEKAISDTTRIWDLHHRDEIRVLPSGMIANRSRQELIENGRYFNCPANELIFLTHSEHQILHKKSVKISSDVSDVKKGKHLTAETRQKISEARKGKTLSEEQRKQLRKHKDITVSQLEDRKTYMREYQRIYRAMHPDYYRNRSKKLNEERSKSA